MFTNIKATVVAAVLGLLINAEQQFEAGGAESDTIEGVVTPVCSDNSNSDIYTISNAETDAAVIESLASIVSPSGYQFDPTDDKECREKFVKIEQLYLDTKD